MRAGGRAAIAVAALLVTPFCLAVGTAFLVAAGAGRAVPASAAACAGTPPPDGPALDEWMRARVPASPLVGLGAVFADEAGRVGLDPRFLVAIAVNESALGTAGSGAGRKNPFGLGPGMRFPTWQASIRVAADTLRDGYLAQGRTTIAAIGAKWAPIGAANDPTGLNSNWVGGVTAVYIELGGPPDGTVLTATCQAPPTLPGARVPLPMAAAPRVIGTPNAPGSTHAPGSPPDNWQSDNAVDLAMPTRTPLTSVCAGVVGPRFGMLDADPDSRFGGMRLTVVCDGGVSWYYAHLSAVSPGLGPGVRVTVDQPVGASGVAAGVPHLHLASSHGDPMALLGLAPGRG